MFKNAGALLHRAAAAAAAATAPAASSPAPAGTSTPTATATAPPASPSAPALRVLSPERGDVLFHGSSLRIQWEAVNVPEQPVSITLERLQSETLTSRVKKGFASARSQEEPDSASGARAGGGGVLKFGARVLSAALKEEVLETQVLGTFHGTETVWRVPSLEPGVWRMQMALASGSPDLRATSDSFRIQCPELSLQDPAAGAQAFHGEDCVARWRMAGVATGPVLLQLHVLPVSASGKKAEEGTGAGHQWVVFHQPIADTQHKHPHGEEAPVVATIEDGARIFSPVSYHAAAWRPPPAAVTVSEAFVRLCVTHDSGVATVDSPRFELHPPSVRIVRPGAGEKWPPGAAPSIMWVNRGTPYARVHVHLAPQPQPRSRIAGLAARARGKEAGGSSSSSGGGGGRPSSSESREEVAAAAEQEALLAGRRARDAAAVVEEEEGEEGESTFWSLIRRMGDTAQTAGAAASAAAAATTTGVGAAASDAAAEAAEASEAAEALVGKVYILTPPEGIPNVGVFRLMVREDTPVGRYVVRIVPATPPPRLVPPGQMPEGAAERESLPTDASPAPPTPAGEGTPPTRLVAEEEVYADLQVAWSCVGESTVVRVVHAPKEDNIQDYDAPFIAPVTDVRVPKPGALSRSFLGIPLHVLGILATHIYDDMPPPPVTFDLARTLWWEETQIGRRRGGFPEWDVAEAVPEARRFRLLRQLKATHGVGLLRVKGLKAQLFSYQPPQAGAQPVYVFVFKGTDPTIMDLVQDATIGIKGSADGYVKSGVAFARSAILELEIPLSRCVITGHSLGAHVTAEVALLLSKAPAAADAAAVGVASTAAATAAAAAAPTPAETVAHAVAFCLPNLREPRANYAPFLTAVNVVNDPVSMLFHMDHRMMGGDVCIEYSPLYHSTGQLHSSRRLARQLLALHLAHSRADKPRADAAGAAERETMRQQVQAMMARMDVSAPNADRMLAAVHEQLRAFVEGDTRAAAKWV